MSEYCWAQVGNLWPMPWIWPAVRLNQSREGHIWPKAAQRVGSLQLCHATHSPIHIPLLSPPWCTLTPCCRIYPCPLPLGTWISGKRKNRWLGYSRVIEIRGLLCSSGHKEQHILHLWQKVDNPCCGVHLMYKNKNHLVVSLYLILAPPEISCEALDKSHNS